MFHLVTKSHTERIVRRGTQNTPRASLAVSSRLYLVGWLQYCDKQFPSPVPGFLTGKKNTMFG